MRNSANRQSGPRKTFQFESFHPSKQYFCNFSTILFDVVLLVRKILDIMKKLIACHNEYYVIGLKDQAYLVFDTPDNDATTETIIELLPSTAIQQSATPEPVSGTTLKLSPEALNPNQDINNQQKSNKNDVRATGRHKPADEQLKEICAVAIVSNNDEVAEEKSETIILKCAVARNNKSLDIYTVKIESSPNTSQSPSLQYCTPKRVSCFAFAYIDAADGSRKEPVLISGDVAGDSYAYNLKEKGQRLLVGHTASMLTDIAIIDKGNSALLLTSDRDEKIRISRFPDTYVIEGFLLGHTTYVTGFVVIPSSPSTHVVSCGGDRTLRIWDLAAQTEISSTSTISNDQRKIPTAIAASCCGQFVAVIFDDSRRLSIYKIVRGKHEDDYKPSLELLGNVDCPSQPLSISFHETRSATLIVLVKNPDYIIQYDITDNQEDLSKAIATSQTELNFMKSLRKIASQNKISMPNTILEKDDYGNPILRKENETRGPAAVEAPWNRVERVEIAKERERRRKKTKISNDS